jgi:hypothetical protein
MHICNRCEARHKVTAPKCIVCGFKKLTEWKAGVGREGIVAISSPALPKDTVRIKIGWKNTVKSIENNEGQPRPGRWIAFYVPTSYMPLEKDVNANGFRVTLTIKLLTKGTLRYHGITPGSDEFTEVKDNTIRLSKLMHGWHYAQVTGSGTEANHTIALELEERAYARCEDSPESKPLIPWTFWYFPFSKARLPVAFLDSEKREEEADKVLQTVKEEYAKKIEALKEKRVEDEKLAKSKLNEYYRPQLEKAKEVYDDSIKQNEAWAETAKANNKKEIQESYQKQKEETENDEALRKELLQTLASNNEKVDLELEKRNKGAEEEHTRVFENLKRGYDEDFSRIKLKLDHELKTGIEELQRDEEKELRKEKEKLFSGKLLSPLITFDKYFSEKNELEDARKAMAWESNPKHLHCGDKAGWTGHCDAAGFASAMFEEPVDKGIWKGEELKFIVTEYFMSYIVSTQNTFTTWQLGDVDDRNDPSHLNFIGYFRDDLESLGEYARKRANEQKVAAGKNGASLLEKLQAALSHGMPVVTDMRVDADFSEDTRVQNAQAVWNHCVFCYVVRYRESDEATGGHEEMARDLVAHITIYANEDHSPPTSTKAATINETVPPDITVIPKNCIIRHFKVRLQFAANGKIDINSDKSDWLGCYAEQRQTEDLIFQYRTKRLPPRYLTLTVSKTPTKRPMANPYITAAHIEALVKAGFLKWTRKLD